MRQNCAQALDFATARKAIPGGLQKPLIIQRQKKIAIRQACDCPSGRLVVFEKGTGKAIEPEFEPSISLTKWQGEEFPGPFWVKGNVEIESHDGRKYEKRNRITLCHCGKSRNKPFCDGSHMD
jgi:hypothetical protein